MKYLEVESEDLLKSNDPMVVDQASACLVNLHRYADTRRGLMAMLKERNADTRRGLMAMLKERNDDSDNAWWGTDIAKAFHIGIKSIPIPG